MTGASITLPAEVLEQLAQRVADILEERAGQMPASAGSRWLSVEEAADYMRCRPQRIYDLRSSGRISRHADGARALVDRQELDRLVGGNR